MLDKFGGRKTLNFNQLIIGSVNLVSLCYIQSVFFSLFWFGFVCVVLFCFVLLYVKIRQISFFKEFKTRS